MQAKSGQPTIGVIGGGSWGTALAVLANRAGSKVSLVTRNRNVIELVRTKRMNDIYLPGVFIDPSIDFSDDLSRACHADFVIIATPSHCMRAACVAISDALPVTTPLLIGSKGIERGSLLLMTEVVQSVLPKNPTLVLSGPNFAGDAARGLPTATTIASQNLELAEALQYAIGSTMFRPYINDDVVGTQIGGTVKNVVAIACGIARGKELGDNASAALITRGFAEMMRLALVKGGRSETLSGLSGLGDLILTATAERSRNTSFGMRLGQGEEPVQDLVESEGRGVIEGAISAESVCKLAKRHNIEMPICEAVHRVLNEGADIESEIKGLLDRPFSGE